MADGFAAYERLMTELLFGTGITHSILIISFCIGAGLLLGRLRVRGVSFGTTWILFSGLALSHFGLVCDPAIVSFVKDFGLVLFVFSIGLSVGPSFFRSFKKGALSLNILAAVMAALSVAVTALLHVLTGESLAVLTGVMSGAVTNTPGLGAAQAAAGAQKAKDMAASYAVAYPFGVIGTILALVISRSLFKVDIKAEAHTLDSGSEGEKARRVHCRVENPALFGKTLDEVAGIASFPFIVSRVMDKEGNVSIAHGNTVITEGCRVLAVSSEKDAMAVKVLFGEEIPMHLSDWERADTGNVVRQVIVTKPSFTGKRLDEIDADGFLGVTVTRVMRSGQDMVAAPSMRLQVGDALRIVGTKECCQRAALLLGNKQESLIHPNLVPIFFGIALGVALGSVPIKVPFVPQGIKLGIAGGPLIVAILLGYFGPRYHITTYTTMSANLMIREMGISLFMAAVGLSSGQSFVAAILAGGWRWAFYGAAITVIPIAAVITAARVLFKINFLQISGLVAGGMTSPPVLSFAGEAYNATHVQISYAAVYPLTMFLRVLAAQVLVLSGM